MYKLSKFQYRKIKETIDNNHVVIVMPFPNEFDVEVLADALDHELGEIHALQELGLVDNITLDFEHVIWPITAETGRDYEVFLLTNEAVALVVGGNDLVN